MKFRRLTTAELTDLETEFVQFLVANTITGEDWVKLKAEEPEKANHLIDLFSDIVLSKVIENINFLEFRTPKDAKTFHCLEDKIVLNGLIMEGTAEIDLMSDLAPELMMSKLHGADVKLQVYTAEKGYKPDRETELFRMLEAGALISKDGQLFHVIEKYKQNAD